MSTFYFAAHYDSEVLIGCKHPHSTVISAANCISCAGGFVVAVEDGNQRALNPKEQRDSDIAVHGRASERQRRFSLLEWPGYPQSNTRID
jgi:hypothetical protein